MLTELFILGASGFVGPATVGAALDAGLSVRELGAELLGARAPRSVPRRLASLVAGSVAASSFSRDVPTDPSALFATGFAPRYASIATGLPATIERLEAR